MFSVVASSGDQSILSSGLFIAALDKPAVLELKVDSKTVHIFNLSFKIIDRLSSERGLEIESQDDNESILVLTIPQGDTVTMTGSDSIAEYNDKEVLASFKIDTPTEGKVIVTYTFLSGKSIKSKSSASRKKR